VLELICPAHPLQAAETQCAWINSKHLSSLVPSLQDVTVILNSAFFKKAPMPSALGKWKNMDYIFTMWKEEEHCP